MASFSPKKYFKKIYTPTLLTKYYETHRVEALFPITEGTPRKTVIDMMIESYTNLPPEKKIDITRELALLDTVSTKHATSLIGLVLKEHKVKHREEIESTSDADKVLSFSLYHKDLFDEILFLHDFYKTKGYMLYEAKEVDIQAALYNTTELTKEFTRIVNTDERATDCDVTAKVLDGLLYVHAVFDGSPEITPTRNNETGQIDHTQTKRKLEQIRIVYLPKDKEVLISYSGSKQEKIIFLDTFLRVICSDGYMEKIESFDLSKIKEKNFDFANNKKGVALLTWKIKAITLSFGSGEKFRKKLRITLPSTAHENGLAPLYSTLEELKLTDSFQSFEVENATFLFSFSDKEVPDANVNVPCSVSLLKSSLCPLFTYDRLARSLLKQSGIDEGFIEQAIKEKESVTKKWEV